MDRFEVIVLGMGCGGMTAADRLLQAGRRVVVVERERIGGECAYWACIPSKTLLRGPEQGRKPAGPPGWPPRPGVAGAAGLPRRQCPPPRRLRPGQRLRAGRRHRRQGRRPARRARPGGGRRAAAGSRSRRDRHRGAAAAPADRGPGSGDGVDQPGSHQRARPPRPGAAARRRRGRRRARPVLRGGGRAGHHRPARGPADRPGGPRVGELAEQALSAQGVTVHTGVTPASARKAGGATLVTLDDGSQVETDALILGAGRRPATAGFGLEAAGVTLTGRGGIAVDEHCRAGQACGRSGTSPASPCSPRRHVPGPGRC